MSSYSIVDSKKKSMVAFSLAISAVKEGNKKGHSNRNDLFCRVASIGASMEEFAGDFTAVLDMILK